MRAPLGGVREINICLNAKLHPLWSLPTAWSQDDCKARMSWDGETWERSSWPEVCWIHKVGDKKTMLHKVTPARFKRSNQTCKVTRSQVNEWERVKGLYTSTSHTEVLWSKTQEQWVQLQYATRPNDSVHNDKAEASNTAITAQRVSSKAQYH